MRKRARPAALSGGSPCIKRYASPAGRQDKREKQCLARRQSSGSQRAKGRALHQGIQFPFPVHVERRSAACDQGRADQGMQKQQNRDGAALAAQNPTIVVNKTRERSFGLVSLKRSEVLVQVVWSGGTGSAPGLMVMTLLRSRMLQLYEISPMPSIQTFSNAHSPAATF